MDPAPINVVHGTSSCVAFRTGMCQVPRSSALPLVAVPRVFMASSAALLFARLRLVFGQQLEEALYYIYLDIVADAGATFLFFVLLTELFER